MKAYFLPNQLISKLQLYSKSGNVTEYNFSNIKTDVKIADKLFEPSFSEQVPRTLP
jgi:outer membrane lipoprotein-sorting protein